MCKRTDADVAKCVRTAIEKLRPKLKTGIPELNVPAIEPLNIPEIVISRGNTPSGVRASLNDVNVFGIGDFQINSLKYYFYSYNNIFINFLSYCFYQFIHAIFPD